MSDEQQAVSGEEEKVISISKKIPPTGAGNLRVETALARLQSYVNDFRGDQRAVKQAAQTFREALQVQPKECTAVIRVLQAVRQKTASCLEFLEGESAFWAHRLAAVVHLYYLDGEETARLILRLDAFRSKCLGWAVMRSELTRTSACKAIWRAMSSTCRSSLRSLNSCRGRSERSSSNAGRICKYLFDLLGNRSKRYGLLPQEVPLFPHSKKGESDVL